MPGLDLKQEDTYFKLMAVLLLFLLVAFDTDLAMIYLLIMIGDWMWKQSDNFISFPLSSRRPQYSSLQVYLESLAALGIFLVTASLLVKVFSPQAIAGGLVGGTQSIFQLLATTTPILKGNTFFTWVGWGIAVPIIETSFFNCRLLEGLSTYAEYLVNKKIPLTLSKISVPLIVVVMVVASLFTLFHITAKGISSIPLLITFLFSIISSVLVIRHRELKGAVLMHMATNSAAVMASLGWF